MELGQGVLTALAQVAAEELSVDLGHVRMMAIGKAVQDALGVGVRTPPFTAENIVAAMDG